MDTEKRDELVKKLVNLYDRYTDIEKMKKAAAADYRDQLKEIKDEIKDVVGELKDEG